MTWMHRSHLVLTFSPYSVTSVFYGGNRQNHRVMAESEN